MEHAHKQHQQRNSIGSKGTVPWGTPTVVSFDFSPTIVRIDLAVRKFVSHLWILPFIPYWCNLQEVQDNPTHT
jgi:hypothetical protein